MRLAGGLLTAMALSAGAAQAEQDGSNDQADDRFKPIDVFELEYAADPQISPDGKRIVYVRRSMDIMTDRQRSNLWSVNRDGTDHRPLLSGTENYTNPRWSPDGTRLLYIARHEGSAQLYVRWMDTGQTARVTNLTGSPGNLSWSPDGTRIAFTMEVPSPSKPLAEMPDKPEDAKWAPPVKVVDQLVYRADGQGFLDPGYAHVFVVPADGGTPRQLTSGAYDHGGALSWAPDGQTIVVAANRVDDWEYDPLETNLYAVSLADGSVTRLTDRKGPDSNPAISPDGRRIAYTGFDDRQQGYQIARAYLADADGSDPRVLSGALDREIRELAWRPDGRGVYIAYDDEGVTKLGFVSLSGDVDELAADLGGTAIGRPYPGSAAFTVARDGTVAALVGSVDRPADLAAISRRGEVRRLTRLNDDLLAHRTLGQVEEIWYPSSADGRRIHGWIVKPPHFDADKQYPLILEIHGGPFANYGPRFSAEVQLFAAAGYVVLYTNPRGSTSYGEEFGNLIHHAYPGQDYDDLMAGIDAVIAKGYVDPDNLFVTGGSGGGVLTAWTVGNTDRFRAAVVAKPVINWTSFVLTADYTPFFYKYWFPGFPWDHPEHYRQRSPLSLVGNVSTPTMLLTGEADYRTPISETEQFYQALKLRQVDTVMVRVPDAPHGIAGRPSNLIAKVVNILAWFDKYRTDQTQTETAAGDG